MWVEWVFVLNNKTYSKSIKAANRTVPNVSSNWAITNTSKRKLDLSHNHFCQPGKTRLHILNFKETKCERRNLSKLIINALFPTFQHISSQYSLLIPPENIRKPKARESKGKVGKIWVKVALIKMIIVS